MVCAVRSAATVSASLSSSRSSWVGTSEVNQVPSSGHSVTGSCPATSDRQITWTPATYDGGRTSTQRPAAPRRRSVAATEASTAARESSTRLGAPVEPEVSTTRRTSSGPSSQPRRAATTSLTDPSGLTVVTRRTLAVAGAA